MFRSLLPVLIPILLLSSILLGEHSARSECAVCDALYASVDVALNSASLIPLLPSCLFSIILTLKLLLYEGVYPPAIYRAALANGPMS